MVVFDGVKKRMTAKGHLHVSFTLITNFGCFCGEVRKERTGHGGRSVEVYVEDGKEWPYEEKTVYYMGTCKLLPLDATDKKFNVFDPRITVKVQTYVKSVRRGERKACWVGTAWHQGRESAARGAQLPAVPGPAGDLGERGGEGQRPQEEDGRGCSGKEHRAHDV